MTVHAPVPPDTEQIVRIPVQNISPSPYQPRKKFDEVALSELADSIREQGVLQAIVVRPSTDGRFELVIGERRWRATQLAQLTEIPAVVREYSDKQAAEAAIVENLQREDLTLTEQAQGMQCLHVQGFTFSEIGRHLGKTLVYVHARLNVLKLPAEVQAMLDEGKLVLAHVDILLELPSAAEQITAAEMAWKQRLTATQLKARTQHKAQRKAKEGKAMGHRELSRGILALHEDLQGFQLDPSLPEEKHLTLSKQITVLIKALRAVRERLGHTPGEEKSSEA